MYCGRYSTLRSNSGAPRSSSGPSPAPVCSEARSGVQPGRRVRDPHAATLGPVRSATCRSGGEDQGTRGASAAGGCRGQRADARTGSRQGRGATRAEAASDRCSQIRGARVRPLPPLLGGRRRQDCGLRLSTQQLPDLPWLRRRLRLLPRSGAPASRPVHGLTAPVGVRSLNRATFSGDTTGNDRLWR